MNKKLKKICFVLTVEYAVKAYMLNHLRALSKVFDVTVIVNTQNKHLLSDLGLNVTLIPMPIQRQIHPLYDFWCLLNLVYLFVANRYNAVHSVTPKAGLLTILAGWLTLRPMRVHTFQGEVWVTKKGLMRKLLISMDKLVSKLATHLTVVGKAEKDFLLLHKVIDADKAIVFHEGSIAGVDLSKFYPSSGKRKRVRQSLGITESDTVLLFVGRINRDKGILDLAQAFALIDNPNLHLLIVGPDEQELLPKIADLLAHKKNLIHFVYETDYPEDFMNAADLLCLPSYREGFNLVIIEAAACGIPALASRIYGIIDTIVENETGVLHTAKDIKEINQKILLLANDQNLRMRLGQAARTRVIQSFDSKLITKAWVDFYLSRLN